MNKITEITSWKTSDGKIWQTKFDAEKHQNDTAFRDWYMDHRLSCAGAQFLESNYLCEWLREHKARVLEFLR